MDYICVLCGELLAPKDVTALFGLSYCADCAAEILTEDDVLEDN